MRLNFGKRSRLKDSTRYEDTYKKLLNSESVLLTGIESINSEFRRPFESYYQELRKNLDANDKILELGSGSGIHTNVLCELSKEVYALDISSSSLQLCSKTTNGKAITVLGSIDSLPFDNSYFDAVVSVGSLSYAKWDKVVEEVLRTLKPGGKIVFLDSLNNNPIFILNRFIHVLRSKRTLATVIRIPTYRKINNLLSHFEIQYVHYFDSMIWLRNNKIAKCRFISKVLTKIEAHKLMRRLAFKFVAVGIGLKKH